MADATIYNVAGMAIFDLDGTLISLDGINGGHGRAIFHALKEVFGIENANFDGIDFHGMTDFQLIMAVLKKYQADSKIDEARMIDMYLEMADYYKTVMRNVQIEPLPGVTALLGRLLSNRVMSCLITGSIGEIAALKLKKAGLAAYLYVKETGDSALLRSDLVRRLMKRNKVNFWTSEDRIILFGDTVRDVEAGRECGIKTVAVATGLISKTELETARPDYLFDNLTETDRITELFI